MKKMKISELQVTSFVTGSEKVQGGLSLASGCGLTCATACSWTDGQHVCKT